MCILILFSGNDKDVVSIIKEMGLCDNGFIGVYEEVGVVDVANGMINITSNKKLLLLSKLQVS